MTELLFYHLQGQSVETVLPTLIEKSLARGWQVIVQASSDERVDALDAHLWTFRDDAFVPHGTYRDKEAPSQPVLLTIHDDNLNGATVRFLVDRAPMPKDIGTYERVVILFDGNDEEQVSDARARWAEARRQNLEVTYWQADNEGRWQRKA